MRLLIFFVVIAFGADLATLVVAGVLVATDLVVAGVVVATDLVATDVAGAFATLVEADTVALLLSVFFTCAV